MVEIYFVPPVLFPQGVSCKHYRLYSFSFNQVNTDREARVWQHHVVGVLYCSRDWCTSQNRWLHEEGKDVDILKQHLKTSVKAWSKMDKAPQHTSKVVAQWLKDNNVKVLEWPSQNLDLNPIENVWAELKTRVRARRPTNLTQKEWARIQPIYCGKLVDGYPTHCPKLNNLKAVLPNTN